MRKLLVMSLTAMLVAGCDISSDGSFVGPPTSCSNIGQKQFVLDALYDWWLWNADLPANISIADYATPEELVIRVTETYGPRNPDGTPVDRFSSVGSLVADQQFFGEGKFEGFGFRYNFVDFLPPFQITGVFEDSPAGATALERGQIVVTLNGRSPVDIQAAEGILAFFDNNDTVTFVVEDLQGNTLPPIEITKGIVTIDPIPLVRIIDIGPGVPPVGYMRFDTFISTAHDGIPHDGVNNRDFRTSRRLPRQRCQSGCGILAHRVQRRPRSGVQQVRPICRPGHCERSQHLPFDRHCHGRNGVGGGAGHEFTDSLRRRVDCR